MIKKVTQNLDRNLLLIVTIHIVKSDSDRLIYSNKSLKYIMIN